MVPKLSGLEASESSPLQNLWTVRSADFYHPWVSLMRGLRCIPKMDHHCPWTNNCVSHFTSPHFIRFLFYAVASMLYLEYFIYVRGAVIWKKRTMPSVGPCPSVTEQGLIVYSTLALRQAS